MGVETYGGVALLWLATLAWEYNQFRFVQFEALSVHLQRFDRFVATSVINSNADGLGLLLVDACSLRRKINNLKKNERERERERGEGIIYFQLIQWEAATSSNFGVVSSGRTVNHWSNRTAGWSRCQFGRLGNASSSSPLLSCWLIKPSLDVPLPPFVKMAVWYYIVSLWRHLPTIFLIYISICK